jgi:hypothetical protein
MLYAQVYYYHSFTEHFFNTLNLSLTLLSSSIIIDYFSDCIYLISLLSNYLITYY